VLDREGRVDDLTSPSREKAGGRAHNRGGGGRRGRRVNKRKSERTTGERSGWFDERYQVQIRFMVDGR
jgi:hypothetical protein